MSVTGVVRVVEAAEPTGLVDGMGLVTVDEAGAAARDPPSQAEKATAQPQTMAMSTDRRIWTPRSGNRWAEDISRAFLWLTRDEGDAVTAAHHCPMQIVSSWARWSTRLSEAAQGGNSLTRLGSGDAGAPVSSVGTR